MHTSFVRVHSLVCEGVLFVLLTLGSTALAQVTYQYDPDGRLSSVSGSSGTVSYSYDANGNVTNVQSVGPTHPAFFNGEVYHGGNVYQLTFVDATFFGYYSYMTPPYIFHYGIGQVGEQVGLGFEYVDDANDGASGVYIWDSSLVAWLYTNPSDFPWLYDFASSSWLYYYAGTSRYFTESGGQGRGTFFSPAPS